MTNHNVHEIMRNALAIAAGLGFAGFLYYLWVSGIPTAGFLVALGMTLFVCAMTVAGVVVIFWGKE